MALLVRGTHTCISSEQKTLQSTVKDKAFSNRPVSNDQNS